MSNLSQIKRQRLMDFLERIKIECKNDDDALVAIGEIESELNGKKYGKTVEIDRPIIDRVEELCENENTYSCVCRG